MGRANLLHRASRSHKPRKSRYALALSRCALRFHVPKLRPCSRPLQNTLQCLGRNWTTDRALSSSVLMLAATSDVGVHQSEMEARRTQGTTKCSNLGSARDPRAGYCSNRDQKNVVRRAKLVRCHANLQSSCSPMSCALMEDAKSHSSRASSPEIQARRAGVLSRWSSFPFVSVLVGRIVTTGTSRPRIANSAPDLSPLLATPSRPTCV
jgi:hypothetical protein